MPAQTVTIPNPACMGSGNPSPVCTSSSGYVSDSASGYVAAGATFWSELPNPTRFHIAGLTYKSHSVSSIVIAPGGICGVSDSGFRVNGHLTAPLANAGDHTKLTLCLDADTGPGTTGNFNNDISSEISGNSNMTIATVGLDPTSSQLKIT